MFHGEGAEDPGDEQQTVQFGLGGDVCRAGGAVDQRHLAEVVTGAKGADGPSMHIHGRPPVHDDAEGYAGLPSSLSTVPAGKVRSFAWLASRSRSFLDSMENSGTLARTSCGVVMTRCYARDHLSAAMARTLYPRGAQEV